MFRAPSAPDHFLYYFLYYRAHVSSPERPRSLSLLLSLLQSSCFEPRAPQITFFTTFFTIELMCRAPSAPDHFLHYFLYDRAYVSSPERPSSLSLLLSLLQSL